MNTIKPIDFVPPDSRLTFIKKTSSGSGDYRSGTKVIRSKALYQCVCGNKVEVAIQNAKNGTTRSCGCLLKDAVAKSNSTHSLRKHPLYYIWTAMKQRCYNRNNPAYGDYGGRGVIVCEGWINDFKSYHEWAISNGWQYGMEIDKDKIAKRLGIPALEYSPEMCSIVTQKENLNITRRNHPITFNGKTQNISQWQDRLGFGTHTIQGRQKLGWPVEKIISTPLRKAKHERATKGMLAEVEKLHSQGYKNFQLAKIFNVDPSTISRAVNKKSA